MVDTIIVSNRLPVSVRKVNGKLEFYPSAGGLATSMSGFTKNKGTIWIGWPGLVTEDLEPGDKREINRELAKHHCKPLYMNRQQFDNFYNGYSNSVLWPLMHNMPLPKSIPASWWKSYKVVNELFAGAIEPYQTPKSSIWVHDYQLLMLPHILRKQNQRSSIGFFLHIPFPDAEHFLKLNEAPELVKGMLGADLVGFHTKGYCNGFLQTASTLGFGMATSDQIVLPGRTVSVSNFPIGINYHRFTRAITSEAVRPHLRKFKRDYGKYKVILTVDRLDPTKAFPERLRAYERLLQKNPQMRGKVIMVMIAVPTRGEIDTYKQLKTDVDLLVSRINGAFGTKSWQPIEFRYTTVPFEELSALYQIADVAFVAPLRDGMNLVAKEYIASKAGGRGALILSTAAGAAEELAEAILVNPKRQRSLVSALTRALTMPPSEVQKRLDNMQKTVRENGVQQWAGSFMNNLAQSATKRRTLTKILTFDIQKLITSSYHKAKRPLFLFDYDGVLTPFFENPDDSKPSDELKRLLKKLASARHGEVAIVSGRSRDDLQKWLSDLPLILVSEHGACVRMPGEEWKTMVPTSNDWKPDIRKLLEEYAAITPGAFVEEKEHSLVWHYRAASAYYAQKNIVVMRPTLLELAKENSLGVYHGNKIIEVKPPQLNKRVIVDTYLAPHHDFVLAIGDDYTDEYMFSALPDSAYTVKVGFGRTAARHRLKDVNGVIKLLKRLAN